MNEELRGFQKRFIRGALAPGIDVAALSVPRGNGKSWLAAHLLQRALTPRDELHVPGAEYLLCAGSIEQARLCFRFIRVQLEPSGEYRFLDSSTRIGIAHKASNTRLRILSSNGKTAMGIVGCPLLVADEPGSWEVNGGTLMYDAIITALGKPMSPMRAIFIGTLAPAMRGWWHDLIADGSTGSTYVQRLQGDAEKWDSWAEIKRCNPLTAISPEFRKRLRVERDAARLESRLKARFLSFRLNRPSGDESEVLLTVADWERVTAREVPERVGKPIVGVDLGGGRAWSAAVALYPNGRVEARAVAPGIPDLDEQERRDRVPAGTYSKLFDQGALEVASGLRVQPPAALWDLVRSAWGKPRVVVCDRFRLAELQDATGNGVRLEPRVSRWSEAAFDIRSLRKMAKDGPLAVEVDSRLLLATSLSKAVVKNDDQGVAPRSAKRRDNFCGNDRKGARSMASSLPKVHSTPRVHPGTWLVVSWMGVYTRVVYGCQPESHKKQGNGERPHEMGRRHARRPYDGDGFRGFRARA